MKKGRSHFIWSGLRVFLVLLVAAPPALQAEAFRVGPGDELRVSLRLRGGLDSIGKLPFNNSLVVVGDGIYSQIDVTVSPDGTLSLPTLHSLPVNDKTLEEIEHAISSQWRGRPTREAVSVSLLRQDNPAYFITGEVGTPGRFVLQRPTTLLEALSMAGGPTTRARLKDVQVIRHGTPISSFDLSLRREKGQWLQSGDMAITVQKNDTIIVPRKRTPDAGTIGMILSVIGVVTGIYIASRLD